MSPQDQRPQDLLAEPAVRPRMDSSETWYPAVPRLRLASSLPSLEVMTMNSHVHSNGWFSAQTFTSRNIQVSDRGIGFFAIPIMVLAGTPAGPPSAPRRHAAHQVRGIARQQDPRGQGPSWVCEKSLYEDQGMTHIASDAYSSRLPTLVFSWAASRAVPVREVPHIGRRQEQPGLSPRGSTSLLVIY